MLCGNHRHSGHSYLINSHLCVLFMCVIISFPTNHLYIWPLAEIELHRWLHRIIVQLKPVKTLRYAWFSLCNGFKPSR